MTQVIMMTMEAGTMGTPDRVQQMDARRWADTAALLQYALDGDWEAGLALGGERELIDMADQAYTLAEAVVGALTPGSEFDRWRGDVPGLIASLRRRATAAEEARAAS
jgi:hypothetical protein